MKITKDNMMLLTPKEQKDEYVLELMLDWQEGYSHIYWAEFKNYTKCVRCGGYQLDQCICYAR